MMQLNNPPCCSSHPAWCDIHSSMHSLMVYLISYITSYRSRLHNNVVVILCGDIIKGLLCFTAVWQKIFEMTTNIEVVITLCKLTVILWSHPFFQYQKLAIVSPTTFTNTLVEKFWIPNGPLQKHDPWYLIDHTTASVQLMEPCRQTTSHNLNQWWPIPMIIYDTTKSTWFTQCDGCWCSGLYGWVLSRTQKSGCHELPLP